MPKLIIIYTKSRLNSILLGISKQIAHVIDDVFWFNSNPMYRVENWYGGYESQLSAKGEAAVERGNPMINPEASTACIQDVRRVFCPI